MKPLKAKAKIRGKESIFGHNICTFRSVWCRATIGFEWSTSPTSIRLNRISSGSCRSRRAWTSTIAFNGLWPCTFLAHQTISPWISLINWVSFGRSSLFIFIVTWRSFIWRITFSNPFQRRRFWSWSRRESWGGPVIVIISVWCFIFISIVLEQKKKFLFITCLFTHRERKLTCDLALRSSVSFRFRSSLSYSFLRLKNWLYCETCKGQEKAVNIYHFWWPYFTYLSLAVVFPFPR